MAGAARTAGTVGERAELLTRLRQAAARLEDVDEGRLFGCEVLFANGAMFAMVVKAGRIGVKLPDAKRYAALAAQPGSEPWLAGRRVMTRWLLLPPALVRDAKKLAAWVAEAHAMAAVSGAETKPAKKTKTAKNTKSSIKKA